MTTRIFVAGSTALLLLAVPAVAGQSSRAEHEATRQLNLEQSQRAQSAAPQVAVASPNANAPMNSPPSAAPTARVQSAAMGAPEQTLSSLVRPPMAIASANVRDTSGQIIGAVQKVEVTPQGAPTKVSVTVLNSGEKTVVLDASHLKYDAASNEIRSAATRDEILAGQG